MNIRRDASFLVLPLAFALAASACSDDDGGTSPADSSSTSGGSGGGGDGGGGAGGAAPAAVAIAFEGRVGDETFSCAASYAGLGATGVEVRLVDFRLYLHDVRLLRADGTEQPVALDQDGLWQHQDVVLLDFEDRAGGCANGTQQTNGAVRGTVPAGDYAGVAFKLGVPFALNHGDAAVAPSPLNLTGLFWNWNGGYKFLRVDSVPVAGGEPFNLHLGSTGCLDGANGAVTSCERPNVADVVLTGFDPLTTKILVDYAAVVAQSDLGGNAGGAPGCMSGPTDPDCPAVFERLGIDISDGSLHPATQALFRVE